MDTQVDSSTHTRIKPEVVAALEDEGYIVDLETGDLSVDVDHRTPMVLDKGNWLAGLERACGGKVVIEWSIRPEVYFATHDQYGNLLRPGESSPCNPTGGAAAG